MDDALINWTDRTKEYTAKSLCDYILSKDTEFICMSENDFNKLNK